MLNIKNSTPLSVLLAISVVFSFVICLLKTFYFFSRWAIVAACRFSRIAARPRSGARPPGAVPSPCAGRRLWGVRASVLGRSRVLSGVRSQ